MLRFAFYFVFAALLFLSRAGLGYLPESPCSGLIGCIRSRLKSSFAFGSVIVIAKGSDETKSCEKQLLVGSSQDREAPRQVLRFTNLSSSSIKIVNSFGLIKLRSKDSLAGKS